MLKLIYRCLNVVVSMLLWVMVDQRSKEAADYITDDVNDDGLYNAFKYLKLI